MTKTPTPAADVTAAVASALNVPRAGVQAVLDLVSEGATVPFIARYRKEATGGLDEVQIRSIQERAEYFGELEHRRAHVLGAAEAAGKLTTELRAAITRATTKAELEDLYLPFKPKRRTRAATARERGLEPLAERMWSDRSQPPDVAARAFLSADVPDVAAALSGARDICAERLSEVPELRRRAREELHAQGELSVTKAKEHRDAATKFDAFANFSERLSRLPGHRLLAIERGQAENVLKSKVVFNRDGLTRAALAKLAYRPNTPWASELEAVAEDSLARLLMPSVENEVLGELRKRAEAEAIDTFATNLRQLLLAAPLGPKRVLGIDPGQRTGCKCVVVDATGKVLVTDTIYLVQGPKAVAAASTTLQQLLRTFAVDAIAVGNGTHGRETEQFVRDVLREHPELNPQKAPVISVSESGASVYSASDVARSELPDLDVSVRGAVSIARRLQDPLAELVKIDPKSIGVGQYQHDVDQALLAKKLEEVVSSCVNEVGVELNTSSPELLGYVAGVGQKLARQIVAHRDGNGAFRSRSDLLRVKGFGPKAFEQAAGFLRIRGAQNPLDASAVHPESYAAVVALAQQLKVDVPALIGNEALLSTAAQRDAKTLGIGVYTLRDILTELKRPGRDPRKSFETVQFDDAIRQPGDLKPGMVLSGIVTNVTAFGAFVDVGVHQDGLVHISQLRSQFVKDPHQVVRAGERIRVRVLEVDLVRKRISLSARDIPQE